jgi:hypothetical protein
MSRHYALFLAIVTCQVGLEATCIAINPPISPVDWALVVVDALLLMVLIGRIAAAWKTPKCENSCALASTAVGALSIAVFSLLTFTPISEAFVLVSLLLQSLYLVFAIEIHGLFENWMSQEF